jgi:hypothetical protein
MQFINFLQTTFLYECEESLDLINAPNENINYDLYTKYNRFMDGVLAIYGNQKDDGTIPVFWTTQKNDSVSRQADTNSTLKKLEHNQTYYIIVVSKEYLPLTIPYPIDSKQFLLYNDITEKSTIYNSDTNLILDKSFRYTKLDNTTKNVHHFNIKVSGLIPNNNYTYNIKPIFSNWPCDFSQTSGSIDRGGPIDSDGLTSSIISSIFKYESCYNLHECSGSVPYSLIDKSDTSYIHNIFSIFDLNILKDNKEIIQQSFIISCDNCVDIPVCPSLEAESSIINLNDTYYKNISIKYYDLNPDKIYKYNFSSLGSNWPSRIDNISGIIYPEKLYQKNNVLYASGVLDVLFAFGNGNESSDWSNLTYILEVYKNEIFMNNNIYTYLNFELFNEDSECSSSNTTMLIKCNNCILTPNDCIKNLKVSLPYVPTDDLQYPSFLSFSNRPASETNIAYFCCDFDQNLEIIVSGACSGEIYDYNFTSYPQLLISPTSGTFSFLEGSGKLSHLVNLNNNVSSTIHFTATHRNSGRSASDGMIIRCSGYREE